MQGLDATSEQKYAEMVQEHAKAVQEHARGGAQIGRGGVQTEYPGRRICAPPLHVPAPPLRVPAPPLRDFALRLRPIPASKNSLATYGLLLRCKTGATEKAPRKNKWGPRWFQGRHNSLLAIMFH